VRVTPESPSIPRARRYDALTISTRCSPAAAAAVLVPERKHRRRWWSWGSNPRASEGASERATVQRASPEHAADLDVRQCAVKSRGGGCGRYVDEDDVSSGLECSRLGKELADDHPGNRPDDGTHEEAHPGNIASVIAIFEEGEDGGRSRRVPAILRPTNLQPASMRMPW
jgi:hypothetical protein